MTHIKSTTINGARLQGVMKWRAAHMHTFSSCPYFGIVYYLYMFGLTALFAFDPFERALRLAALHYAAIGVCFSIYSMYLQLTFIHAFCI